MNKDRKQSFGSGTLRLVRFVPDRLISRSGFFLNLYHQIALEYSLNLHLLSYTLVGTFKCIGIMIELKYEGVDRYLIQKNQGTFDQVASSLRSVSPLVQESGPRCTHIGTAFHA